MAKVSNIFRRPSPSRHKAETIVSGRRAHRYQLHSDILSRKQYVSDILHDVGLQQPQRDFDGARWREALQP